MTLLLYCDRCQDELWMAGGLLIGPPDPDDRAEKLHLCASCHNIIRSQILGIVMADD